MEHFPVEDPPEQRVPVLEPRGVGLPAVQPVFKGGPVGQHVAQDGMEPIESRRVVRALVDRLSRTGVRCTGPAVHGPGRVPFHARGSMSQGRNVPAKRAKDQVENQDMAFRIVVNGANHRSPSAGWNRTVDPELASSSSLGIRALLMPETTTLPRSETARGARALEARSDIAGPADAIESGTCPLMCQRPVDSSSIQSTPGGVSR